MAVENRGGRRPTAPQYNPANVNGLGGNGQSGKKLKRLCNCVHQVVELLVQPRL